MPEAYADPIAAATRQHRPAGKLPHLGPAVPERALTHSGAALRAWRGRHREFRAGRPDHVGIRVGHRVWRTRWPVVMLEPTTAEPASLFPPAKSSASPVDQGRR